uniref:Uncharacterized protein n=1 Tax=Moniliophthora roreri TaxID=221103 RepID=A0A0W0FJ67_MONRR
MLTTEHPELTTYFEGVIIGSRDGFQTEQWGATEEDDMRHWRRFPAFERLGFADGDIKLSPNLDDDRSVVFMRWKEMYVVPRHEPQIIQRASFAGFYYMCLDLNPSDILGDQVPPTLPGWYFHPNSEPFQQISLSPSLNETLSSCDHLNDEVLAVFS